MIKSFIDRNMIITTRVNIFLIIIKNDPRDIDEIQLERDGVKSMIKTAVLSFHYK